MTNVELPKPDLPPPAALALWKKRRLTAALKAFGIGVLTAVLFTCFIFLLGWLGYAHPACATVAAWLLPTILPVSMCTVVVMLLKSKPIRGVLW